MNPKEERNALKVDQVGLVLQNIDFPEANLETFVVSY